MNAACASGRNLQVGSPCTTEKCMKSNTELCFGQCPIPTSRGQNRNYRGTQVKHRLASLRLLVRTEKTLSTRLVWTSLNMTADMIESSKAMLHRSRCLCVCVVMCCVGAGGFAVQCARAWVYVAEGAEVPMWMQQVLVLNRLNTTWHNKCGCALGFKTHRVYLSYFSHT